MFIFERPFVQSKFSPEWLQCMYCLLGYAGNALHAAEFVSFESMCMYVCIMCVCTMSMYVMYVCTVFLSIRTDVYIYIEHYLF